MAMVTRKIRHKNGDGSIVEAEIGAKAENVLEDANHRFATDTEKTSWNGKVDSDGGDIANTKVSEFAASSTQWPVPAAGESPKTLWGKVKKFTEDFKNWMSGVCLIGQIVNNCVTNNANLPLSAAQGKVLMDLYTVLNAKQIEISSQITSHNHDDRYYTKSGAYESFYFKTASQASNCITGVTQPGIYVYDSSTPEKPGNDASGGAIFCFGYNQVYLFRLAVTTTDRLFISTYMPGTSYGTWHEI